ncbi:MAG TPA: SBBP repeat-containing protein [Isosphaeraceae bacterium]|jgi:hypothetical protein|nr:SBBP repeat-containing protein [Isosphaeraceae bacterium]
MYRRRERRPAGPEARTRTAESARRRCDRRNAPAIEGLEDRRLLTFGLKWAAGLGGGDLVANATRTDSAGDIYVAGDFSGSVNLNPSGNTTLTSHGGRDAFVAKFSSTGALLWARDLGGSGTDAANSLAIDSVGDVYVGGSFQGTAAMGAVSLAGGGNGSAFVAKLDGSGNVAWARAGTSPSAAQVNDLAVDSAGDVFAVGRFTGSANFGGVNLAAPSASYYNGFVVKYNASGAQAYATGFGGSSWTQANAVAVDSSGDAYVGGNNYGATTIGTRTLPYGGGYDGFLAKFNPSGAASWGLDLGGNGTDMVQGVAVDGQGSAYVTGEFSSTATFGTASLTSHGLMDSMVAKVDGAGNVAWAKSFGGAGNDMGMAVAVDSTGAVTVGGTFNGTVAVAPGITLTSAGAGDAFALRLDGNGNATWAQGFGGAGSDGATALAVDGSGNVDMVGNYAGPAIFGTTVLPNAGPADIFVAQLGQSTAPASTSPVSTFGIGGGSIQATATRVDSSGNTYVVGSFSGSQQFDPAGKAAAVTARGSVDGFVAKYSPAGALLWVDDLGSSSTATVNGLAVDAQGNVAVVGGFSGSLAVGGTTLRSVGGTDAFAARLNASGGVLWATSAGGSATDQANAVAVDGTGDVFVTGRFTGQATVANRTLSAPSASYYNGFLAEYSAAGAPVYATGFGGSSYSQGLAVAVDASGNAYVGGSDYYAATIGGTTLPYGGSYDGFVAKFAPGGGVAWAKGLGGPGIEMVRGVAVDGSGNVYITGEYGNGAKVGGATLSTSGYEGVLVARLSSAGAVAWAKGFGAAGTDFGSAIAFDPTGGVVVAGQYQNAVPFGTTTLTSAGNSDAFVLRLDTSGNTTSAFGFGGVAADAATGVDVSSTGNVTAVGSYFGPALFGATTLQSHGTTNVFVTQIGAGATKALAAAQTVAPPPSAVTPTVTTTPLVTSLPSYKWQSWSPRYTDAALQQLAKSGV